MKLTFSAINRLFPIVFLLIVSYSSQSNSETLRLAVASNFSETAQLLAKEFELATGHEIHISSGSSGKLFHQIVNGAPYDIFFSADTQKPQSLAVKGLAVESTRQTYSLGQLALWFKRCPSDVKFSLLTDKTIHKIALANPKLAPYGLAAQALLKNKQLWDKLKTKLVFPENVAQVAQLAKLGVVDAAFIAGPHFVKLNIINSAQSTSCGVFLNHKEHPPIAQDLVLLNRSHDNLVAKEFIAFALSTKGQDLIKNMGYLRP